MLTCRTTPTPKAAHKSSEGILNNWELDDRVFSLRYSPSHAEKLLQETLVPEYATGMVCMDEQAIAPLCSLVTSLPTS